MIFQHTVQLSVSVYNLLPYQPFNCCADSDHPCKHNYALANRHFRRTPSKIASRVKILSVVGCVIKTHIHVSCAIFIDN